MSEHPQADAVGDPPLPRDPAKVQAQLGYVIWLAGTASVGGFLFGFDSAVVNGAVSGLQSAFHSGNTGTGFEVAAILLGCALGALVAGRLADFSGRRPTMILTAFVFGFTAAGAAFATSAGTFSLARFLSGMAVGAASVVTPAYIAEVSPPHIRGRLGALQQLGIVVGIFAALLSDDLIARAASLVSSGLWLGLAAWRWMFLVEVLPAAVFAVGAYMVPESPRYLVAAHREEEALEVLRNIEPHVGEEMIAEIRGTLTADRKFRLRDLHTETGSVLPIVWVGVGLSVLQQFVGINSIFYYGSVLWEAVGFSTSRSLAINVVTGLINVVSTLLAIALIDRVGRKPLLLWGSIGMTSTLAILVGVFSATTRHPHGQIVLSHKEGVIALLAANLFVLAFGMSWGPCVWVLLGEMFSNRIRGTALAVAVFAQWIANWAVTVSFPVELGSLGPAAAYGTYLFFAVSSIFFVARKVRETRGRALEQM